ncbi:MAG: metallophosphatase [Bacteroidales bacterium]|jgi:5'-nucleotidase
MKSNRRDFLKLLLAGSALSGLSFSPFRTFANKEYIKLTILHTNDTHSHIDPFPANDPKYPGMGGFARRAEIIKEIRNAEKNILLLDAGDIYQGTPYFNMYGGEPELKLMSLMGYDAATIGNHEFDNGLEGILNKLPDATFPFINSNYDFSNTILAGKILPYKIFDKANIKIGVFGLGVELEGLVNKSSYGNTVYLDPIQKAAEISHILKYDMACNLIICLSHMGYIYNDDNKTPSDFILAKKSKNIDLIIGGHTHTFIDKPYKFYNSDNKEVYVCQVGWAGIKLGRLDFYIESGSKKKFVDAHTIKIFNNQV